MINIGDFNKLKVTREAEFGFFLDAETGNTSDDILLPTRSALNNEFKIGDEVDAFIYRDSKGRLIATLKKPFAKVGDLAYLEVVDITPIGSFVGFGLERDILVPFKEETFKLEKGRKYLFYIYLDKTGRLAASTYVDKHLHDTNTYNIGDEVEGIVYGFQTNGSAMVAIDNMYRAVILKNEYYTDLKIGEKLQLRVKKYYEDSKMSVSPRKARLEERDILEEKILEYMNRFDGFMPYNDSSSPEDIKRVFQTSKNAFKRALGGLMKKGTIEQDTRGTKLK